MVRFIFVALAICAASTSALADETVKIFGHVMGDAFEEPVLLIKLAWGGKSLARDFRPPSSGGDAGPYYQEIVELTKQVLADAKSLFPQHADRKLELAGFAWHQGFVGTNDFYRPQEQSPSGQAYHWNSNAETYYLIGEGMGKAMLQLWKGKE